MLKSRYVLHLILALSLLLGAGSALAQDDPVTLVFVGWGGPDEIEVFQSLVDTFNAANPDVILDYQPIPDDYVTALTTMIAGGTPPDIAYVPDGDFSAFVTRGQLVNIQEFVDASEVIVEEEIWPSALGRYKWDEETRSLGEGDLYALPKDIGPTALFINVDLFKEMGVELPSFEEPMTWDELVDIGTQLTVDANGLHPGEDGFDPESVEVWGVGDIWMENAVYGNGGRIISADGREFVMDDDEKAIEAIQFISDLTHYYQVHPTSQQTASMSVGQMFETGKLAMTTCGRWCTTNYRNVLDFEFDVIPNPVGPSGELTTYQDQDDCTTTGWSGSVGVAIIAGSMGEEYAEQAYKFVEYIAGAEGQAEQAALGFQIPNQVELSKTDVFLQPDQDPGHAEVFVELARCALPGPWTRTPLYGQWFDDNFWGGIWPAVVVDNVELAEDAILDRADAFQEGLDEAWASIE